MSQKTVQTLDGGKMCAASEWVTILQRLGLASLEQAKTLQGELVKNHRGRRDIFRITTTNVDGQPLVFFLKRILHAYKKDGLTSLLKHGAVWSISRAEWENCRALERAGLRVGGLVAYGEECGLFWENFSFIITQSAPGRTLEDFLQTNRNGSERRRVFDALAREIRKMHAAGLATPDLFTRHIFVETDESEPTFCLIDMARLDQHRRLSNRTRARDLAALNSTAPLRFVSARERVRFLQIYAGKRNKALLRLIKQRLKHLLTRRKFQDFFAA